MKKLITIILSGLFLLQTAETRNVERDFAFNNYRRYYSEARSCTDPEKTAAWRDLRVWFRDHPQNMKIDTSLKASARLHLSKLLDNGTFTSMNAKERYFKRNDSYRKRYHDTQKDEVGIFIGSAFKKIFQITSAYRLGILEGEIPDKVLKAIVHYGNIEVNRPNDVPRFHASCFAIPTGAVNVYFSILEDMDKAESGQATPLMTEACDMLKAVALQAWTQPLRNDATDANVVSLERFRKHVWWVGGNALAYRQLLPVAVMYRSIPMVDLLAEICQSCISVTSQVTYDDSFWTEGFTSDGAGWGHGRQSLIWGYPIHGTSAALRMLGLLKGTPWARSLDRENAAALMNFFRGGSWYWYKGWRLIGLDRNSYLYNPDRQDIPYRQMLDNVIADWLPSFTQEEQEELLFLQQEAAQQEIDMKDTEAGTYHGLRWFFNNDDLIRKDEEQLIAVNMASIRCDGLECVKLADPYNFYCDDGATLLLRDGNEYFRIMGGWDVTAYPGTTSRTGRERLETVNNWNGYCSRRNYAGAVHDRNRRGVAGYIFDKTDARVKYPAASTIRPGENAVLYGLQAYKSWFFIDDFMVALGAGITNRNREMPGMIRTTLDQTALEAEVRLSVGRKSVILTKDTVSIRETARALTGKEPEKSQPVWITQQGKFSYSLLPEYSRDGTVALATCPTDWIRMNCGNKNLQAELPAEVDILSIWTEHGQDAEEETYGYTVWTGKETPPARLPFKVERNDTLVQAVSACRGKLLQAVFYPLSEQESSRTDALEIGRTRIEVSAPCVLMLDRTGKHPVLHVSDPTMNPDLENLEVRIGKRKWTISLPQGERCGDCAHLSLK